MRYTTLYIFQIIFFISFLGCLLYYIIDTVIPDIVNEYKLLREEEIKVNADGYYYDEMDWAREELLQAEQDFELAEGDFVEAATYRLKAAQKRFGLLVAREKK